MQGFMDPCQVASCIVVRLQCISVLDPIHPGFIEGLMEECVCVCVCGWRNEWRIACNVHGWRDGWMDEVVLGLTHCSKCLSEHPFSIFPSHCCNHGVRSEL